MDGSSKIRDLAANLKLAWFDYWLLCGLQLAALLAVNIRVASLVGAGFDQIGVYLDIAVISILYVALTSATAAILPRKAGMPVVPIIESWRAGSPDIRRSLRAIVVGLTVGFVVAYASVTYERGLISLLNHPIAHTAVSLSYSPLSVLCTAIIEEILFRATIFAALAVSVRRLWQRWSPASGSEFVWAANSLQALIFGAAHVAFGFGILKGFPWYARVPLVSQTWGGLIIGWIYWRYGLESAIACHAAVDFFLMGGTIRLSLFR